MQNVFVLLEANQRPSAVPLAAVGAAGQMPSTQLRRFDSAVQILVAIAHLILDHRELGLLEETSTESPLGFSPASDVTLRPVSDHIIWGWQADWDHFVSDGGRSAQLQQGDICPRGLQEQLSHFYVLNMRFEVLFSVSAQDDLV